MEHHDSRRAKAAWEKLQAFEQAAWCVVVLTVPGSVWNLLRDRQIHNYLRRRAVEVVRAWSRRWIFFDADVDIGGTCVAHPTGEAGTWQPHFNVILPAVAVLSDGAYKRGRHHVDPRALDALRHEWACELVALGWEHTCSPQVDYEYRISNGQKHHAARYFFRHFTGWQSWTHRVTWFGFLRGKLEAHDPPPWSDHRHRPGRCSICGGFTDSLDLVRRGVWKHRQGRGFPWVLMPGQPPWREWADVYHGQRGSGRAPPTTPTRGNGQQAARAVPAMVAG